MTTRRGVKQYDSLLMYYVARYAATTGKEALADAAAEKIGGTWPDLDALRCAVAKVKAHRMWVRLEQKDQRR